MSRETTNQKTADYIQPDRRTEITRLTRHKNLALIIWLGSTWAVFMYVWITSYDPLATPDMSLNQALLFSLVPATIAGLYYFNERRTVNPKILRLMKYELLFSEFIETMYRDMERNDLDKGDSWLTLDFGELLRLMREKTEVVIGEFGPAPLTTDLPEEIAKLSNYCAMIYLRSNLDNRERYNLINRSASQ